MRNVDEETITAAVLARVAGGEPRASAISAALVRHLHAFIREVQPTQAEWQAAIDFLTRTGQMCSAVRQEFILLSDTLGASMLVDAINHRNAEATASTVLGPFYVDGAPECPAGSDIGGGVEGAPLLVEGSVSGVDGHPIAGATVDTWHSDAQGFYDVQRPNPALTLRGRFRTGAQGAFWYRSIVPSCYPIPDDGPVGQMLRAQGRHPFRPAHVHFRIAAPGYETLVTHVFLAGDRYLDSDVVFGVKDSLVRALEWQAAGVTERGNRVERDMAALRFAFVLAPASA